MTSVGRVTMQLKVNLDSQLWKRLGMVGAMRHQGSGIGPAIQKLQVTVEVRSSSQSIALAYQMTFRTSCSSLTRPAAGSEDSDASRTNLTYPPEIFHLSTPSRVGPDSRNL